MPPAEPGMMQPQAMGLSVEQQQQMGVQSFAVPQPGLPQAMSYVASAQQQQMQMQQFPHGLQQVPSMITPMPFPMTAPGMQLPETALPPAGTMQAPQQPAPGPAGPGMEPMGMPPAAPQPDVSAQKPAAAAASKKASTAASQKYKPSKKKKTGCC